MDESKRICEIGRRMYDKGFAAANDGNISVKLSESTFLCTPTGVSKGCMTPDMLCLVDEEGHMLEAHHSYRPSSEIFMHLSIYRNRPDVQAVVHAHPPYATAYAVAGIPLCAPILSEAVIMLGCVPIAPYGTPSTQEVPDSIVPYLPYFDTVLLANHGALSFSTDLLTAYHKMESLEHYAQLSYLSHNLGGARRLTPGQVSTLHDMRHQYGISGSHPMKICGPECPFKDKICHL